MKRQFVFSLGVVALLAFSFAAQPAPSSQIPATDSPAAHLQQAEQVQKEVQAELAKAQQEIDRAVQEVTRKIVAKNIAKKMAAHRGAMLADLHARGELTALRRRRVAPTWRRGGFRFGAVACRLPTWTEK
jgi:Skp family chaperone for outer membrane proteins